MDATSRALFAASNPFIASHGAEAPCEAPASPPSAKPAMGKYTITSREDLDVVATKVDDLARQHVSHGGNYNPLQ